MNDLSKHPCFNGGARHRFGRIHLPVAPRCNMQCNFCNRKYDCVNEGHPGVTSAVLSPSRALEYLEYAIGRRPEIAVAGLAGPGDPFANPDQTMETLRLVRGKFSELLLCVATNGLALGPYIDELAALQVYHVTLTVNAVRPEVGAGIYSWIRDAKVPMRGAAAAARLWEKQRDAIVRLKAHGITVKINSIVIPGVNEGHIPEIAAAVAELGADMHNCMPMVPVGGAEFEGRREPDAATMESLRSRCGRILPQMLHCARCRADAAGLISDSGTVSALELLRWARGGNERPEDRPFVAVASYEGALVNQHLGEADNLRIYEAQPGIGGGFRFRESRPAPPRGGGDDRWLALADTLRDCRALLVASAGPRPQELLAERGLRIMEMEGLIDEGLDAAHAGREVPAVMRRRVMGRSRGIGCKGSGTGCG